MRRRFGSIKFRVVAVVVLFTLTSALASVSLSLRHFQRSAREGLLQSAEFNLNLVAGVVNRDLDALGALRDWCGVDGSVSGYVSGSSTGVADGIRAFSAMNGQVQLNRAYQYLLRTVAVSQDYQRILQCGSGTTAGIPLNPYTINRLEGLERDLGSDQWSGVITDPFTDVGGTHILYSCGPITSGTGRGHPEVGTVFLMVSTALITDSIASYQLPEGCHLWLTVGGRSFVLDGALSPIESPVSSTPTADETFNVNTRVTQCTGADGVEFLSVSCPIGGSGLWLTQTISPKALNASFQGLYGSQLLLLVLCSILIGAVVLWLLSRTINRPILRLQARMDAISQGDFSPDPSIEWDNELGDVGRGINHLAHSVEELMERRLADEKARQELEYQMLQSQINPHFLYNSLNSIKWMATIQNADGTPAEKRLQGAAEPDPPVGGAGPAAELFCHPEIPLRRGHCHVGGYRAGAGQGPYSPIHPPAPAGKRHLPWHRTQGRRGDHRPHRPPDGGRAGTDHDRRRRGHGAGPGRRPAQRGGDRAGGIVPQNRPKQRPPPHSIRVWDRLRPVY